MEYEWRITAEDGGDPTPVIEEILKDHGLLSAYRIVVDDPNAAYLEFGTMPSNAPARPKEERGKPTEVELRFRDWVRQKMGYTDEELVNSTAHRIYKDIMRNGMAPHPFMRPAMYTVLDEAEAANINDPYLDHHTIEDMANEISDCMKLFIDLNDIGLGNLADSIRDPEEVTLESDAPDAEVFGSDIDPELWNDRTRGVNPGRTPRTGYREVL